MIACIWKQGLFLSLLQQEPYTAGMALSTGVPLLTIGMTQTASLWLNGF